MCFTDGMSENTNNTKCAYCGDYVQPEYDHWACVNISYNVWTPEYTHQIVMVQPDGGRYHWGWARSAKRAHEVADQLLRDNPQYTDPDYFVRFGIVGIGGASIQALAVEQRQSIPGWPPGIDPETLRSTGFGTHWEVVEHDGSTPEFAIGKPL